VSVEFPLNLATNKENYVNKLSIWTAYFMFLLSVVFLKNAGGNPTFTITKKPIHPNSIQENLRMYEFTY
jgi:hypothetical protein